MSAADNGREPSLADRIEARVAELRARRRLSRTDREELATLTYEGPIPRRLPPSDEVPF